MGEQLVAGIETGGTKILARMMNLDGKVVAGGRWVTGTPAEAFQDLVAFLTSEGRNGELVAVGIAAFGPLITDRTSADYGLMLSTPKQGWTGSNLCAGLAEVFDVPVIVDSDVNAAAVAEQAIGAGEGLSSVAYVTVGTGIGAGLAIDGCSLTGAMHPEVGHLQLNRLAGDDMPSACRFHADCAEGLVSGPAVRRRLGERRRLSDDPLVQELVAQYLGQLAASIVLFWSPHRIVWGGGAIAETALAPMIEEAMREVLNGYGVGPAAERHGFCVPAVLEDAGLEGALMMARRIALDATG
jgi:fructokinase